MRGFDMNSTKIINKKPSIGNFLCIGAKAWGRDIIRNYDLYILVLPGVLFYIIFDYLPMLGVQIAFKNFSPSLGIFGSKWVGLRHFTRFFSSYQFWNLIKIP